MRQGMNQIPMMIRHQAKVLNTYLELGEDPPLPTLKVLPNEVVAQPSTPEVPSSNPSFSFRDFLIAINDFYKEEINTQEKAVKGPVETLNEKASTADYIRYLHNYIPFLGKISYVEGPISPSGGNGETKEALILEVEASADQSSPYDLTKLIREKQKKDPIKKIIYTSLPDKLCILFKFPRGKGNLITEKFSTIQIQIDNSESSSFTLKTVISEAIYSNTTPTSKKDEIILLYSKEAK